MEIGNLTDKQLRHLKKCRTDFAYFCRHHLRVKPRGGRGLVPLVLKKAQEYFIEKLLQQLEDTGSGNILLLKGRRMGMSTVVAAFFLWLCIFHKRRVAAFVAHSSKSLVLIRDMTYLDLLRNAEGLGVDFDDMLEGGAEYRTFLHNQSKLIFAWASGNDLLRGADVDYLHLSEVAFYDVEKKQQGQQLIASALSTVPLTGGIVIMETTSAGPSGKFHELWEKDNEWLNIFLPWWWDEAAVRTAPPDFELSDEVDSTGVSEREYKELVLLESKYELSDDQMMFRRFWIETLGADWNKEYPRSDAEAFAYVAKDSFIPVDQLYQGLAEPPADTPEDQQMRQKTFPLVFGIDLGGGRDKTVIAKRRGHVWEEIVMMPDTITDPWHKARWLAKHIKHDRPKQVQLDSGGLGYSMPSMLRQLGCKQRIIGIDLGSSAQQEEHYANIRAEGYHRLKEMFVDGPKPRFYCSDSDRKALISELLVLTARRNPTRWVMRAKEDMKKDLSGHSPDRADAVMLSVCMDDPMHDEALEYGDFKRQDRVRLPRVHAMQRNNMKRRGFGRRY